MIPIAFRSSLRHVAISMLLAASFTLLAGCSDDDDPTGPGSGNGGGEPPAGALVELMLGARTPEGAPLGRAVDLTVGQDFDLVVSYADLRPDGSDLGAFQILVDLLASESNVLRPVLSETQRVVIDGAIVDAAQSEPGGLLTFGLEGSLASHSVRGDDFVADPDGAMRDTMAGLGLVEGTDFTLERYPEPDGSVFFQIRWSRERHGNVDAPDLVLSNDFTTSVPMQFIEFGVFGPDGVSINPSALLFNVDVTSPSFNDGEPFYSSAVRANFDADVGFTDVGGVGPIATGGVRELTNDGGFPEPFEAFRLRVEITTPVAGLEINLQAADGGILFYGLDEPLAGDEIHTDEDAVLRLDVQ